MVRKVLILINIFAICNYNCEAPKNSFYYNLFSKSVTLKHWEDNPLFSFDNNGVLLANGEYNVVSISQYALKLFNKFNNNGGVQYLDKFLLQVEYLFEAEEQEGYFRKFPYQFQFHNLKPGWYSGLAQAEVAMVYLRYYSIFRNDSILNRIIGVTDFMIYRLSDCRNIGFDGSVMVDYFWVHEYYDSDIYNYVLNGAVTSLIALFEVYSVTGCLYYYNLFEAGVNTVLNSMPCFISISMNSLFYDLKSKAVSSGWYVKSMYLLFEDLYCCIQDSRILHFKNVISYLSYNIYDELPHCKLNDTTFAYPCEEINYDGYCFYLDSNARMLNFYYSKDSLIDTYPI